MGAVCAVLAALSIVFAVQWQQEKAAGEELRMQNEQLSMTLSDLQMQLDGSQVSPEGGDTAGIPEGDMPMDGGSVGNAVGGGASPSVGTDVVIGGAVAQDGGTVILG